MSTQRVVLYLDVDGVVAPIGATLPEWPDATMCSWRHPMSAEMGARLAATGAEIVWVTTWGTRVVELAAEVWGWPPHRVLARVSTRSWWKLDAVAADVARTGAPFVWADDDLEVHRRNVNRRLRPLGVPHLLVSPNRHIGLSRAEVDTIGVFCDRFVS